MIKLLIDGDWLIYTAGFAGQKTVYFAPELSNEEFPNMTAVKDEAKAQRDGEPDTGPVYSRTIVDPLDHVLHTVKKMIESQEEAVSIKFSDSEVDVEIYLDGDGNFRSRLATLAPYKGNRSSASKPVLFNEIRQYLLDRGANVVFGIESDDALAVRSLELQKDGTLPVICAVDKDMLQVPGWHLNPNKGFKKVSEAEGRHRLYVQAAMGDAVDNIKGAYKVGPKAAQKAFEDLKGKPASSYFIRLLEVYEKSVEKYGNDIYNGLSAEEAAQENLELVYLLRSKQEVEDALSGS